MKNICIGILAHVDAGKTTLSEAMLFQTGTIRKAGRVDHKDAFLDTDTMERDRGITVFSKEARFSVSGINYALLDTPGHADFSCEMERTLRVLDYAILVVSGSEGVQSHTMTLWKLLKTYEVPTLIFVNKMDMREADHLRVWNQMKVSFGEGLFEVGGDLEELSMCSESLMDEYIAAGSISDESIARAVNDRICFPVLYGSALKMEGTEELLRALGSFANIGKCKDTEDFSAIIYKISRDKQGVRQTHLKVTGGTLKNKMLLKGETLAGEEWNEKVEQIRLYNSTGYDTVSEAGPGQVVAVTGLTLTYAGQYLGYAQHMQASTILQPALTYRVGLTGGGDNQSAIKKFAILEEENPSYHFLWDEEHKEIHVQVMGDLELDVLEYQIRTRLGLDVKFDQGSIIYKETINKPVIGIGHYEPLRHYAEVQLLLEPLPRGSGLEFGSLLSEDILAKNWQRLIMTHLTERRHRGTLTNSEITDMRISIVAGRASNKHTEGGDFRKATYRAIRQGLRQCLENGTMQLLEPEYSFTIQVPSENIGRVMSDMERLGASCQLPDMSEDGTTSILRGRGPVATLRTYQREINTFARGKGRIMTAMEGYADCHNQEEVCQRIGYDPDTDGRNQAGSVFCQHGAGTYVDWQEVAAMAHTEPVVKLEEEGSVIQVAPEQENLQSVRKSNTQTAGNDELQAIFERTYGKSKRDEQLMRMHKSEQSRRTAPKSGEIENFPQPKWQKEDIEDGIIRRESIIIDGYNVIFGWEELKELASINIDSARDALLDILDNYQGYTHKEIIVVFDGYKVSGNPGTKTKHGELDVVYTRENETADSYIEKAAYESKKKDKRREITVVTSDRLVQMSAMGDGALRYSASEFHDVVESTSEEIRDKLARQQKEVYKPFENLEKL